MSRVAKYTTLNQVDLPAVAKRYKLDELRLAALPGGAANSSFHLFSATGEFVLTILDNHDMASAERLATHTQAVFRLGVPTTEVVPTVDGELATSLYNRPMILKRWIEGVVTQPLPQPLLPDAGRILAQLHTLSPHAPGLGDIPVGTRRLSSRHTAVIPQFDDRDFADWLIDRLGRVRAAESGSERPKKVTHGDFFDDNLVVRKNGRLSVLDWETISLDDPLLDLGMAAVGLAQEDGVLVPERLNALVAGYREIAPLKEEDAAELPMEIVHAALIIAFHRYYRHNIRFPDPSKRTIHIDMIKFVDSVEGAARHAFA